MVAVTGIVTAGASALGLAAALTSMHLPTKSYRVERKRRLSQPQAADQDQGEMARLALQKTHSTGSITEKTKVWTGAGTGTRSTFQPGKKVLGRVRE
ncbi:hypothetical protein DSL72_000590 [Monilinia vaccinii-corymbosi]|uniref:Uncharacterized protein n=1 Tax=Monilinia vaccinii-corymbosi TaxID=61207 RepID=A0A8A3P9N1_9HELO|nr:hypothetical protein DSL72_000590 [Monilinia vaccinii-corymbosi]